MRTKYEDIEKYGLSARGKKEILAHLEGNKLTLKQAVNAKCYDCMGFYADGKVDCEMPSCTLYPFMPYNPNRIKKTKTMTDDQKKAVVERFKNAVKRSSDNKTKANSERTQKRRRQGQKSL